MAEKKTYVGNGKKREFDNGGSLINISLKYADLKPNDKGYVNLVVGSKKETDQWGNTHAVWVNDYKPKAETSQQETVPQTVEEDLPF